MNTIPIIFNVALLLCVAYASILGGKTGRSGSLIFVAATILTITANRASPTWLFDCIGGGGLKKRPVLADLGVGFSNRGCWNPHRDNMDAGNCAPRLSGFGHIMEHPYFVGDGGGNTAGPALRNGDS